MRFQNVQIVRVAAAVGVALTHIVIHGADEFGAPVAHIGSTYFKWFATLLNPMFFAVSGFVLAHAVQSATPGRFLVNRFVRLYPGYWMALALVLGSIALGLWPGPYNRFGDPAPTRATFLLTPPGSDVRINQYPLWVEWTLIYEILLGFILLILWLLAGKKRLPWATAALLLFIGVKSVIRPNYGSHMMPSWKNAWVSVYVVPYLLGVLAYHLRSVGRGWRWSILAAAVGLNLIAVIFVPQSRVDAHYWLQGTAAAALLWVTIQLPAAAATNPLVIAGDYCYGLYLLHVPLLLFAFRAMQATEFLAGTVAGIVLAGVVAITLGLAFGRFEFVLHRRMKAWLDRVLPKRPPTAVGWLQWPLRSRRSV